MISRRVEKQYMCLSIEGALRNLKRNNKKSYATHNDGRLMTNNELFDMLMGELKDGKEVLPIGDCDNFDYKTGCRGHCVTLLVHDYEFEEGNG